MITGSTSKSQMDDPTRFGGVARDVEPESPPDHELDSHDNETLYSKLKDWYEQESDRQSANRYQQDLDVAYYDALQWTEEDAQVLMNRGQAPLVFNEIKPTIDWLIGTERRTKIDHKILPRRKEGVDDAENKTKLLKYLSDVNKTPYHRSRAFSDAIKAGIGWLETGIRGDDTDELLYTRAENWRNMLYDSNAVEPDLSDARYIFRWKWLDEDIAVAYFPGREDKIRAAVRDANKFGYDADDEDIWYMGARVTKPGEDYQGAVGKYHQYDGSPFSQSRRNRVKLVECWYKIPALKRYFANGDLYKTKFDPKNPQHVAALQGGYSLYDKLEMEIRCAIFVDGGLLFDGKSPYNHERLPFVPVWCYRRSRDNAPYGCIRNLRDPQDDLNKRASKALWILSSNRVVMDKGAVDDIDEMREEIARPDSIIIKNPGKELSVDRDVQLANEHLQLMERDILHIRNVGGVNNENLGRTTNADSGRAIIARQEQGGVVTTEPFDNLRFAIQCLGEMELSNVEQFYTDEKMVRIVGSRGNTKFVQINEQQPDGTILNDVTEFQADYVVAEQDYRSTVRQAMFESLFDITGRLAQMNPQVALNMLDLVIEMADLPNKDELVQRIRQLSGQKDPDEEIPEEQQAMQEQQAQQAQAQVQAMTQRAAELELAQKEAAVQESQARAEKLQADAQKVIADIQGIGQQVDNTALNQAAEQVAKIQKDAQDRIDNLVNQVAQLQIESKNRSDEINKRHDAELKKAEASKEATIQAELIKAETQKEIAENNNETQKQIAMAQNKTDLAIEALNGQLEKVVSAMTGQIEALGKKLEEKSTEKEPAEEKETQPTVINVNVDAKQGTVSKKINIKKDAAGNITGAEVEETED